MLCNESNASCDIFIPFQSDYEDLLSYPLDIKEIEISAVATNLSSNTSTLGYKS